MESEPDMSFDIDALFTHLVDNLGHQLTDEKDWVFRLQAADLSALENLAQELETEFLVQLQEELIEIDPDGNRTPGDPLLNVVHRGALTAEEVKQTAARLQQLALDRGLRYEGVDCYDPIDEDELFGWLPPEDAGWRLRHLTDSGLPEDAELPWAFLVLTSQHDHLQPLAEALTAAGFPDGEMYDEPDDEGRYGLCVFVAGRNNEPELYATAERITECVESHHGTLEGIQFYTQEELEAVFGPEDDDEPL